MPISKIEDALNDFKEGKMIILADEETRENEGDLVVAGEFVTPEIINFMATYAKGLICLAMAPELIDKLKLSMMTDKNESSFGTGFTVSIEARKGVSTGISAKDRATTILTAVAKDAKPEDLVSPGHIFPLRANPAGVLGRAGQTEGSVDLAALAGLTPAGVICEIMKDDGEMARMPDLEAFSKKHNIKIITTKDLIKYRMRYDKSVIKRVAEAKMPTKFGGEFKMIAYKSIFEKETHIALVKGEIKPDDEVLVRVHSECLTGDAFGSLRCDCGEQLQEAMKMIAKEGKGVILYMRQEGRGIGLEAKVKAYHLQDSGLDTVDANTKLGFAPDLRDYGTGAQMLVDLGVSKMKLMTNNPKKIVGLEGYNLHIVDRVPIEIEAHKENIAYLTTKQEKMGHIININEYNCKECK